MKKKIVLITCIISTISILSIIIFNSMDNKENNIMKNIDKDNQIVKENMITMMYETEAGSGEYIETKDNTWPETGYIFNDVLSGCEKGGELDYNQQNNTVNLLSNSSDQCYVYFDKYDGVWIDNVSITNVTGSSVTLDVSATSENGNITTYYYALNDSEEYTEVGSNPIVINDLNKLTEYKISIYCFDSTNAKSNIYEISVSTTDETGPIVSFAIINEITSDSISLTLQTESERDVTKYHYSNNNGVSYATTTSSSYTFTNLNKNTTYNISVFIENDLGQKSNVYTFQITTENILTLAEYIINLYTSQGENGIYYHTSSLTNSAGDNGYRYSGINPNNYVCFGSNSQSCPEENLYRIIGVIDNQVKLIKLTSIGNYYWSGSKSNTSNYWSNSTLNKNILNETFLNTFSNDWQNMISETTWKSGCDHFYCSHSIPQTAYDYEVGTNSNDNETYKAKIGLMYIHDFGFATTSYYWNEILYSYEDGNDYNWLYLGDYEWTITRVEDTSSASFNIMNEGYIMDSEGHQIVNTKLYAVRPVFFLNDDVPYILGDGSQSNPFRIQV